MKPKLRKTKPPVSSPALTSSLQKKPKTSPLVDLIRTGAEGMLLIDLSWRHGKCRLCGEAVPLRQDINRHWKKRHERLLFQLIFSPLPAMLSAILPNLQKTAASLGAMSHNLAVARTAQGASIRPPGGIPRMKPGKKG